jgi:hypothetical protein
MSPCGKYRYRIERQINKYANFNPSIINFIMLNPSTADASHNDPTLARVEQFARSFGYDKLVVTNLFALRATNPAQLRTEDDPVGPGNESHLVACAIESHLVVLAWGNAGAFGSAAYNVSRHLLPSFGCPSQATQARRCHQSGTAQASVVLA